MEFKQFLRNRIKEELQSEWLQCEVIKALNRTEPDGRGSFEWLPPNRVWKETTEQLETRVKYLHRDDELSYKDAWLMIELIAKSERRKYERR